MVALDEPSVAPPPVATSKLVRTWFILVPLLYYANGGSLSTTSAIAGGGSSRFHQIGLLTTSIICFTLIVKRFSAVFSASLRMTLIVALPVLAFLSCGWSVDPRQSLISAITLLCFTLFAIYLTETFTTVGLLDLVMLTGFIAVPVSILLALLVPSIGATAAGWRGIFTHKQQCAGAVTLFLVTAVHWKPTRALHRPLRAIYVVLCLLLLAMSQSRTGWLLTLFALTLSGTLWLLQKLPPKDSLVLALTAIPIISGLIYLFSLLASLILTTVGKDPTLDQRTIIWAAAWDAILHRPLLGYGYEAFWKGLQGASSTIVFIAGWTLFQAQSGYLDLWLQLGVLSLVILALMTLQAGGNAIRSFRRSPDSSFVRWCIVVILCNLVYNIGESDFGYLRILWLLFLIACIGLKKQAEAAYGNA